MKSSIYLSICTYLPVLSIYYLCIYLSIFPLTSIFFYQFHVLISSLCLAVYLPYLLLLPPLCSSKSSPEFSLFFIVSPSSFRLFSQSAIPSFTASFLLPSSAATLFYCPKSTTRVPLSLDSVPLIFPSNSLNLPYLPPLPPSYSSFTTIHFYFPKYTTWILLSAGNVPFLSSSLMQEADSTKWGERATGTNSWWQCDHQVKRGHTQAASRCPAG